jgi:hypothetical protein
LLGSLVYALSTSIEVALISAGVSLAVTTGTILANWRGIRLKGELDETSAIKKARRDYEFEARKRLYAECEPLLFQALELAEDAQGRIVSVARTARIGKIRPDGTGWLTPRPGQGYYYKSTAYMLLAPVTSYKILQRRLTMIDLSLEGRLQTQYDLLKLIFLSFTRDFDLARREPRREYQPDEADPGVRNRDALLRDEPQIYWRQGLYRGVLEMISEALITDAEPTAPTARVGSRCKSLGEFWAELDDQESRIGQLSGEVAALLQGFHPERKPVLWRVLVAQYRLYQAFLGMLGSEDGSPTLHPLAETDFKELSWRKREDDLVDDDVRSIVEEADAYVRELIQEKVRVPERMQATRREMPFATLAGLARVRRPG